MCLFYLIAPGVRATSAAGTGGDFLSAACSRLASQVWKAGWHDEAERLPIHTPRLLTPVRKRLGDCDAMRPAVSVPSAAARGVAGAPTRPVPQALGLLLLLTDTHPLHPSPHIPHHRSVSPFGQDGHSSAARGQDPREQQRLAASGDKGGSANWPGEGHGVRMCPF